MLRGHTLPQMKSALALASDSHSLPCKDLASIITAHCPFCPFTQQGLRKKNEIFLHGWWLKIIGTPTKMDIDHRKHPKTNIKPANIRLEKDKKHRTKPPVFEVFQPGFTNTKLLLMVQKSF